MRSRLPHASFAIFVRCRSQSDITALHTAAWTRNSECCRRLLAHGADTRARAWVSCCAEPRTKQQMPDQCIVVQICNPIAVFPLAA